LAVLLVKIAVFENTALDESFGIVGFSLFETTDEWSETILVAEKKKL
jgi:hypothetical protein